LFTLGSFLKSAEVARIFGLLFPLWKVYINFDKKCVGLHFGRFFHKLNWSPWRGPKKLFGLGRNYTNSRCPALHALPPLSLPLAFFLTLSLSPSRFLSHSNSFSHFCLNPLVLTFILWLLLFQSVHERFNCGELVSDNKNSNGMVETIEILDLEQVCWHRSCKYFWGKNT
jgi:hypothetical protein